MNLLRNGARVGAIGLGVACVVLGGVPIPGSAAVPATRTITYQGQQFIVPVSWPVVDLTAHPSTCARFDQHTVYLGSPGAQQDCPAGLRGRTEAMLIQPASGSAADAPALENAISQEFHATWSGLEVTVTYRDDRATALSILAASGIRTGPALDRRGLPESAASSESAAASSAGATDYTGQGFDPCAAPSAGAMSAWSASPYRAIGIYIGGGNRSCAQPNLTASWVSAQSSAGWKFIPLYVGPQAGTSSCGGCSLITAPTSQGTAAADDAADKASALGLDGAAIYYDMESYPSSQSDVALTFEAAWTKELHARGYRSGVYSSAGTGIADMVSHYDSYVMPDVIDFAAWPGSGSTSTSDSHVPASLWANHQRIHQYSGGHDETYGGVTINIDLDYLDVQLGGTAATMEDPLVGQQGGDFNGDGRDDGVILYHHTDSSISVHTALANANGGFGPYTVGYTVPANSWDWNAFRTIAGDFNGDGRSDLAIMYHHTDSSVSMHTALADASGHLGPFTVSYTVPAGSWDFNALRLLSGDFNGDGRDDAVILYHHTDSSISVHTAIANASGGFGPFTVGYTVPAGSWDWNAFRTIAGDFNGDGRSDLAIMYHHTDSSVSMHTALADASGHLGPFTVSYTVPAGSWDFNALRLLSGDFNGDGRDDAVILYHHTDSSISVHTAIANTSGGFGPYTVGYTVPANSWDWNAFRTIAGDFNGDGRSDLAIMYHHTDSSVSMHTALADTTGHLGPFTVSYTVPAGSWDFNALRLL